MPYPTLVYDSLSTQVIARLSSQAYFSKFYKIYLYGKNVEQVKQNTLIELLEELSNSMIKAFFDIATPLSNAIDDFLNETSNNDSVTSDFFFDALERNLDNAGTLDNNFLVNSHERLQDFSETIKLGKRFASKTKSDKKYYENMFKQFEHYLYVANQIVNFYITHKSEDYASINGSSLYTTLVETNPWFSEVYNDKFEYIIDDSIRSVYDSRSAHITTIDQQILSFANSLSSIAKNLHAMKDIISRRNMNTIALENCVNNLDDSKDECVIIANDNFTDRLIVKKLWKSFHSIQGAFHVLKKNREKEFKGHGHFFSNLDEDVNKFVETCEGITVFAEDVLKLITIDLFKHANVKGFNEI